MYFTYYELEKEPFNITPDPDFLYLSSSHREALASLTYGIEQRKGFIAITGEVGVGKTTVIRSFLQSIDQPESCPAYGDSDAWTTICEDKDHKRFVTIYVFHANVSFVGLLKLICRELEIPVETEDSFDMVNSLYERVVEEYRQDRNVIIIIDEAQNMPIETLENLRMLSNLETSKDKLLQIVLVGQPEFDRMLDLPQLRQLKQRIAVRCKILPLGEKDSADYIEHRLREVGSSASAVFSPGALRRIVKHSGGIPRIINTLCSNALITGIGYQEKPVGAKVIREVIADLEGRKGRTFSRRLVPALSVFLLASICWGASNYWKEIQSLPFVAKLTASSNMGGFFRDSIYGDSDAPAGKKHQGPVEGSAESGAASKSSVDSGTTPVAFAEATKQIPENGENSAPILSTRQESTSPAATPAGILPAPLSADGSIEENPGAQSEESPKKALLNPLAAPVPDRDYKMQSSPPIADVVNQNSERQSGLSGHQESVQIAKSATVVVKKGDNLTGLIRGFYGFVDDQVIDVVKQNNPQIRDTNIITPGQQILLPAFSEAARHSYE